MDIDEIESLLKEREKKLKGLKEESELKLKSINNAEALLKALKEKKTPDWKVSHKGLRTVKSHLAAGKAKLERRHLIVNAQKIFLENLGVTLGFGVASGNDEEFTKSISFNKIRTTGDGVGVVCKLFFSILELPDFEVVQAFPNFKEFHDLAAEVNESKNFLYLIIKAREYFSKHYDQ